MTKRVRYKGDLSKQFRDVYSQKPVRDVVAQTRLDSRYLAAATLFFARQGVHPKELSMAGILRLSLENFVEILIDSGEAHWIETYEEARELLENMSMNLNPSGRNKYNRYIAYQRDEAGTIPVRSSQRQEYRVSKEEYEESVKFAEQFKQSQQREEEEEKEEYISDPSKDNWKKWKDRPAPKIDMEALTGAPRTIARPAEPLKYDMKTAELRNKRQQELEKNQLEQSSKKGDQEDDQV